MRHRYWKRAHLKCKWTKCERVDLFGRASIVYDARGKEFVHLLVIIRITFVETTRIAQFQIDRHSKSANIISKWSEVERKLFIIVSRVIQTRSNFKRWTNSRHFQPEGNEKFFHPGRDDSQKVIASATEVRPIVKEKRERKDKGRKGCSKSSNSYRRPKLSSWRYYKV